MAVKIKKQKPHKKFAKENRKEHTANWTNITDLPYRILIVGSFGSVKTNLLFNLINHQSDIDKIYLYAKEDPSEAKYQFLIKQKSTALKHFNDGKALIEYSNEEYNQNKKSKY